MIQRIARGVLLRWQHHKQKLSLGLMSANKKRVANLLGAKIARSAAFIPVEVSGSWENLIIDEEAAVGRCYLQLLAPLRIGRRAILNDGVRILTGQHSLSDPKFSLTTAPITIGEYAWIATNAMLLPGVNIGRGAVVAAGALVTRDVAPNDIVGGNPAKIIGQRTAPDLDYIPGLVEYLNA